MNKKYFIGLGVIAILLCIFAIQNVTKAQNVVSGFSNVRETPLSFVPNTPTDIVTGDSHGDLLYLANKSGSAVTCKLSDKGTGCGGGVCDPWPDVSLAAHQVYPVLLGNIPLVGGATWSCSASNSVIGYLRYRY